MQLKELTVWWQQRRIAREGRAAFESAATRELYEALDEASMLAPSRRRATTLPARAIARAVRFPVAE
jgi:hypothetical protein